MQLLILKHFQILLFSVSQSDLPQEEPGLVAVAEHPLLQPAPLTSAANRTVTLDTTRGVFALPHAAHARVAGIPYFAALFP